MSFLKKSSDSNGFIPGLTPRSLMATVLCILLAAMYTQYSMVITGEIYLIPESAIPIPAMLPVIGLVALVGIIALLFKCRILSKAELVCVAFATMMAVPLMTQGFWHRFFSVTSCAPRFAAFDYIDAYNDNLWPHGDNILLGSMSENATNKYMKASAVIGEGGSITWTEVEYEDGVKAVVPTISNTVATADTYLAFDIPVDLSNKRSVVPQNPHLATVLAHTYDLEAESEIFCKGYGDDDVDFPTKIFTAKKCDKPTYLHKKGFVRIGSYGVSPSMNCVSNLQVRLGLHGRGSVTFADPKLMSVAALESVLTGRKVIDEDVYNALPPAERPINAVVKPSNPWSLKSLTYILKGYIPLREWIRPALVWISYMLLLCTAFLCVNIMMRRKWAESERYPMPNARIPLAIIGAEDKPDSPFSHVWKNPWAWAGLVFALAYSMLKGWHDYNPRVPDPSFYIQLKEYITNPMFGGMFDVVAVFSLFVCSIAVFFELNVLISIVLGFWICRSAYFIGHMTSLDIQDGFPWYNEQMAGSYIGYFLVVIALSWKYLFALVKDAVKGGGKTDGDIFSPRVAMLVFIICHIGVIFWALYTGSSVTSMLVMFSFLVMVGFVAAKYRAECGSPFGYFTPYNAMVFVAAVGGIRFFGGTGMFTSLILSGFLTVTVFYLIPGMQFEIVQIGRRMRIQPRHIVYTCLIGLLGGLLIGGWVFLSNAYSYGGNNIKFGTPFSGHTWFMNTFRGVLGTATSNWLREGTDMAAATTDWGRRAMVFSGALMVVLTILRQFFAGFWFHPLGVLLGFTWMNEGANWATLLIAWAIRLIVLKVGGAKAVRTKMQPFFIGVFVGCVLGVGIFTAINAHSCLTGSPLFYQGYP